MELKVKFLRWSAGVPVTMLNEKTAEELGIHPKDRISIKTLTKKPKELSTVLGTIKRLVKRDEIAVSSEIRKVLDLKAGQKIDVNLSLVPKSLDYIKKKLNGKSLSQDEMNSIIKDLVSNSLSESEVALFISAMYKKGVTKKETIYLIEAMIDFGNRFLLRNKFVADKHSIGGIPGNRTTPIIISICTCAGLTMPKTSSRAITSAAGTADVIETIAKVEFTKDQIKKIIHKTGACLVWGGSLGIVPADSKIIRIEKMLKIEPRSQLISSIMSKKLAMGSKYILIDIPYGKSAKVSKREALILKRKFDEIGKHFNKKLKCVLTDGSQPIGNGIGPALELIDVINVLDPKKSGPADLRDKSLFLAGQLFEMTGKTKKGKGIRLAQEILNSGKAFEKFKQIIEAQEGKVKKIKLGEFTKNLVAKKSGRIIEIDNKKINSLARVAGCPMDKFSGVYLHNHKGYKLKKGEVLLTIYAESKARLNEAVNSYKALNPIKIG